MFYLIWLFPWSVIICQNDSLTNKQADTTNIIEDVKKFSEKDNFFSKALRSIFVYEEDSSQQEGNNYRSFYLNRNKVIRKINVKVLDVFGPSVNRINAHPHSWVQKVGNSIHVNTSEWLIKNRLLFSEKTRINPFELIETERFLRQNNYIYDARISIDAVSGTNDSVDVNVYVQDVWSISGDASLSQSGLGFLLLKDANFIGLGSELSGKIKLDDKYSSGWTWEGKFSVSNIARTFLTGIIYRNSNFLYKEHGFGINRDFFSPIIKYAGGIDFNWRKDSYFYSADSVMQDAFYSRQDLWFGYAASLFPKFSYPFTPNNFNVSFRIINTNFTEVPELDTAGVLQSNMFYLGRIGFAYRGFYKDSYLFGLGRTEDIPIGQQLSFLVGYEDGEKYIRQYYGIQAAYSTFRYQLGYLFAGAQLGSYRYKHNWVDALLNLQFMYISKLYRLKDVRIRNYLWTRFYYVHNPYANDYLLTINDAEGLRGFNTNITGDKKLVLNYENNFFLPFTLAGFKIALVSFVDLAMLTSSDKAFLKNKLYKGFGVGIRIRNEHLVFGTIQLMFGYYPNASAASQFDYFAQSRSFYQFNQFQFSKPGVIGF